MTSIKQFDTDDIIRINDETVGTHVLVVQPSNSTRDVLHLSGRNVLLKSGDVFITTNAAIFVALAPVGVRIFKFESSGIPYGLRANRNYYIIRRAYIDGAPGPRLEDVYKSDSLRAEIVRFHTNDIIPMEEHADSQTVIVYSGCVSITIDGKVRDYRRGEVAFIPSHAHHEVRTCWFSARTRCLFLYGDRRIIHEQDA